MDVFGVGHAACLESVAMYIGSAAKDCAGGYPHNDDEIGRVRPIFPTC